MLTDREIIKWMEENKEGLKKICIKDSKEFSSIIAGFSIYAMIYKMAEGKFEEIKPIMEKVEEKKIQKKSNVCAECPKHCPIGSFSLYAQDTGVCDEQKSQMED